MKDAIFANCLKEKIPSSLSLEEEHLSCFHVATLNKKKKKVKQLGQETYTKIALSEKNLSLSSYKDIYFFS